MKNFFALFLYLFLFVFAVTKVSAQKDEKVVQFTGIVVSADSVEPVPFTLIKIVNQNKLTYSDYRGFFSFVAYQNDVIEFSAMGFKTVLFTVPDSLKLSRYSWIQVMSSDTVYLSETVIYPWPTLEQFKKAFVQMEIPDDDQERARKNLDFAEMKQRMEATTMDGSMNFRNYISKEVAKNYYNGQYMPNNLLNPFAWAEFIKAWKQGKFKRKD